jgi:hypothetical protein
VLFGPVVDGAVYWAVSFFCCILQLSLILTVAVRLVEIYVENVLAARRVRQYDCGSMSIS